MVSNFLENGNPHTLYTRTHHIYNNMQPTSKQQKTLTILKASAGSGKTFALATTYINILIQNPYAYRNILAVTFTNKATEEMKMRILSQLYGIANALDDSNDYLKEIIAHTQLPPQVIRQRASKALQLLLHNYTYFRVETIDAFFQSVLRNLARELDLTPNLRVELNDKQVQEKAVDQLINQLQPNNQLLTWILQYAKEKINDEQSWNVINTIKKFGYNIFKDDYKAYHDQLQAALQQKNFFTTYTQLLYSIKENAVAQWNKAATIFDETLQQYGATIDMLANKTAGPAGYFLKLKKGTYDTNSLIKARVQNAMLKPETWLTKEQQKDEHLMQLATQLTLLLNKVEQQRKQLIKNYQTANLILKHLAEIRLLSSIENKVRELNNESGSFLLSDTQHLLNLLIEDSDSPFIFEKIGTQIKHVMIDEFQDTSTIQWKNFKILLNEAISHDEGSALIVGDVKQSIYRWRSGDWRLLNNIEKEFQNHQQQIHVKTLETNYRSEKNIVNFNNVFFTIAVQNEYYNLVNDNNTEAQQVQRAYADVIQNVPQKKGNNGYVQLTLLPNDDNLTDNMFDSMLNTIQLLLQQGAKQSSIALLIRTNSLIHTIADKLMQAMPNIKLVSDEAFRLDSSNAVNILIDALQTLMHPDDMITKANLAKTYQQTVLHSNLSDNQLLVKGIDIDSFLPTTFIQQQDTLRTLPAIELVEQLFNIFQLQTLKEESAYLCTFYDILAQYLTDNLNAIDSFIEQWNLNLHSTPIQSDGIEGIRILTIHKSKGLEFDHVIIPYCDWTLEPSDDVILWCHTDIEPFAKLPIIPIDYAKNKMQETYFEPHYNEEHLQNMVDNMNILYVAFTRACKNLFVFAKRTDKSRKIIRSKLIEDSILSIHQHLENSILEGDLNNVKDTISLTYGNLYIPEGKKKKLSNNVFLQPINTHTVQIQSFDNNVEFIQSNQSKEFVQQDDNQQTNNDNQQNYIQLGNILHQLFSKIKTTDDINPVLKQLELNGVLYDEQITQQRLLKLLQQRLQQPKVAEWFSNKWRVFNECNIIQINPVDGKLITYRPDRVMANDEQVIVVDFKFGKPKPQYHDQIKRYTNLLTNMGYHNVKGYLWFVYSNIIEEVI